MTASFHTFAILGLLMGVAAVLGLMTAIVPPPGQPWSQPRRLAHIALGVITVELAIIAAWMMSTNGA